MLRCWSGGSCDPKLRRGGIVFGIPAQEHAAYVGERGGGVPFDPARFTQDLPGRRARAARPSRTTASRRRSLDKVTRNGDDPDRRADMRELAAHTGATIELFGNRNAGDTEGEIFLGEAPIKSDATGQTRRFP